MILPFSHIASIYRHIFGNHLLPIAVFVAVFSSSIAPIKKNGNNGHCRNAVFTNKDSL